MVVTAIPYANKLDDIPFVAPDAANGMKFAAGEKLLLVKNVSAGVITCTLNLAADRAGRVGTKVISVPITTGLGVAGPFPSEAFNQRSGADSGFVTVDFSTATGVTYALLETGEG